MDALLLMNYLDNTFAYYFMLICLLAIFISLFVAVFFNVCKTSLLLLSDAKAEPMHQMEVNTLISKKFSERKVNGSCRTEIAQPKGNVVSIFSMQYFSCVALGQNAYANCRLYFKGS